MRKESYFRTPRDAALALIARAPVVHLATTLPDGAPVLRAMHAVLLDGAVFFHGSPAGEKAECAGQRAVVSAEEHVASVPSWFLDAERGCPAATFYRSAQLHGRVALVSAPAEKARVLQAFMEKYQPEGQHAKVEPGALYDSDLQGTMVLRVDVERVDGKDKLGQNRRPAEVARIVERLWERGAPGDAAAVDAILDANPSVDPPPFLASAQGVRLVCAMGPESADEVVDLVASSPWLAGMSRERIARAHLASQAWVGARGPDGELAGSVRAMSDGEVAVIADLVVHPAWRNLGIGKALLRLLLDHPAVRPARTLRVHLREAQPLFQRFGFLVASFRRRPTDPLEMVLERDGDEVPG
jgi:nitroimidazol reductase NimA-like FMN-containing flavoprotein (pyridoxamine 5'-phosphate oxidase superfamily)/ribosomal protein S18 acetylase RimI-like enzyme